MRSSKMKATFVVLLLSIVALIALPRLRYSGNAGHAAADKNDRKLSLRDVMRAAAYARKRSRGDNGYYGVNYYPETKASSYATYSPAGKGKGKGKSSKKFKGE
jgi:hypothetical protein